MTGLSLERVTRRDCVIAVVVSLAGLVLMVGNALGDVPAPDAGVHFTGPLPSGAAILAFLGVTAPLLWWRAAPRAAVAVALAILVLNEVLVGTYVRRCGVVAPTAFLFAFAAGTQLDGGAARVGLMLSMFLSGLDFVIEFGATPTTAVALGLTAASWTTGRVVRSRGRLIGELEAREIQLREARNERAQMEVATDRARISGELDELLQRRLRELARLADAGTDSPDSATATTTLLDIEHESRRTLEQMRTVVGVLREDHADAPIVPQPTLTHLEAMLVRAKGTGARLTVEGSPRVLPASVELSAYRIVEHLLTALADTPQVQVTVGFGDASLELAVSGPTARRGASAAIDRARERVQLVHGTIAAETRGGNATAVASLPVLATV